MDVFFFGRSVTSPTLILTYAQASCSPPPPQKKVLWQCGMVVGTGQGCGWECLAKPCTQAAME